MTFKSLPLTVREIRATESRLKSIYDAANRGLKGDALALAAGMLPAEYRQLCVMDPVAEMAAQKGAADLEAEMAGVMINAAREGDAKMALEYLKHRANWVATQHIQVDSKQEISIIGALEQANARVIEGTAQEVR